MVLIFGSYHVGDKQSSNQEGIDQSSFGCSNCNRRSVLRVMEMIRLPCINFIPCPFPYSGSKYVRCSHCQAHFEYVHFRRAARRLAAAGAGVSTARMNRGNNRPAAARASSRRVGNDRLGNDRPGHSYEQVPMATATVISTEDDDAEADGEERLPEDEHHVAVAIAEAPPEVFVDEEGESDNYPLASIKAIVEDEDEKQNPKEAASSVAAGSKNKKPLPTNDPSQYYQHTILSTDTFQGICLKYGVTPKQLRKLNRFSGTNLSLAPPVLTIPVDKDTVGKRPDDDET